MMIQFRYCLLGLLLVYGVGFAEAKRTFIIGVEDSQYYPHYAVQDGGWVGFGSALLEAFSQAQGYRFEYRPMPVERLFRSFLSGEVDFKYPDHPEWRKELKKNAKVSYSEPVVRYIDGVSVLPENQGQGVDNIRMLGTLRGFTPVSWLPYLKSEQISLFENDSLEGLIKQALLGRIDGVYANVDVSAASYISIDGQ